MLVLASLFSFVFLSSLFTLQLNGKVSLPFYLAPTRLVFTECKSLVHRSELEDIVLGHCNCWGMREKISIACLRTLLKIHRCTFGETGEQWRQDRGVLVVVIFIVVG